MSHLVEKPTMWFPNRSDTNRPVQLQKQARSLKESVTISIYKCLWFEGKIKVGHCSLDSHVSFPE